MVFKIIVGLSLGAAALWFYLIDDGEEREFSESNEIKIENLVNLNRDIEASSITIQNREAANVRMSVLSESDEDDLGGATNQQKENGVLLANNPDEFGNEKEADDEVDTQSVGDFVPAMPEEVELSEKEYQESRLNNKNNLDIEDEIPDAISNAESLEGMEIGEFRVIDELADSASTEPNEVGDFVSADRI